MFSLVAILANLSVMLVYGKERMMTDTCGLTLGMPFTRYDLSTQSWRTYLGTSLWDLPMSSPTLPQSGSMRSGELSERPMLVPHINVNDYSSLPTPTHREYKDTKISVAKHRPKDEDTLSRALAHLLPTPKARDYKDEARAATNWGKYAAAIQRWEAVLDRPAPAPTVQRKDKLRLNPQFVEWIMGLPDGWVTGHGLSAAQELKMLGNGVVPQQARAAIAQLMERIPA
jgi:site-specific DNA-cytosine methylase